VRILHLSDTHLTASGFDEDGVASTAALDRMLFDARHVPGVDLVLVTGDIADDGSAEGCAAARERVGRFAAERGIPHVYTTGNHDTRPAFTAVFGTGHLTADGADVGQQGDVGDERAAVSDVAGLRVITLDSLVPGDADGVVSDAQVAWLRSVLSTPASGGSIVALHHPPIPVETSPTTRLLGLRDGHDLADALAGSDVHAVLCGHFHLQLAASLRGIPVWVTPGIVTRMDLTAPPHLRRAVTGAGASVVDLGGPFSPMFHTLQARDPGAGSQAYLVDAATWTDVENESADPATAS
jgi:3',5'-cyclic AMP phosphodiesterase CpdA